MNIEIANRTVGSQLPAYLIAEVGLAHEGSLGMAQAFVDAAADAGVDAVKFQTHLAQEEGTARELFRVPVFPQDQTRQDYWRRTAFEPRQWKKLANYTRARGITFLSSPFSEQAVDLLMDCETPAWKIASGEVSNLPLLEKVAATGLPILLSSGMSTWAELDEATELFKRKDTPFAVLQCTSAYPCPPETWGLNLIQEIRARYACPTGLSDHSGTLAPGLSAVALGANILEFHITLGPQMFGPDVSSSLTIEQTSELISSVRQLEQALASPVDKDAAAAEKAELRRLFTKSIVAAVDLSPGTVIQREHLAFKKPGDGIPAAKYEKLLGCRTKVGIDHDQQIELSQLEKK